MEDSQLSGHLVTASYDPADKPARLKTLCLSRPTSAMVVITKDDAHPAKNHLEIYSMDKNTRSYSA